jgi:hypothetical protein
MQIHLHRLKIKFTLAQNKSAIRLTKTTFLCFFFKIYVKQNGKIKDYQ